MAGCGGALQGGGAEPEGRRRGDDAMSERVYAAFDPDAVYDDRADRAGAKFADADLLGYPWQAIIGPRGAAAGKVELKRRATGERVELSVEDAIARIKGG